MKKIVLMLIGIIIVVSCKKKKHEVEETPQSSSVITYPTYMPYKVGNYWIYERFNIDTLNNAISNGAIDSTYIEKDTVIRGNNYYKFVTKNIANPNMENTFPQDIGPFYYRDSLHYIISSAGRIVFSSQDFRNIFDSFGDNLSYSAYTKMTSKDSIVVVPKGNYKTSYFRIYYTFYLLGNGLNKRNRLGGQCYAENIGIISNRLAFFPNEFTSRERRLKRYHLN